MEQWSVLEVDDLAQFIAAPAADDSDALRDAPPGRWPWVVVSFVASTQLLVGREGVANAVLLDILPVGHRCSSRNL
ncbi:hypothetical protein [Microbacterium schleiferi]|uniref:hypothetical protein n=1 Tax=Microbacterium schleiferi TaxID=69362 RepID=UPI00311EF1F4